MSSTKRKLPSFGLERRVRARREEEWNSEPEESDDSSGSEVSEEGIDRPVEEDEDESGDGSGEDSGSEVSDLEMGCCDQS